MPYVRRTPAGHIEALFATPHDNAQEYLPATAPEVCDFLNLPRTENFAGLDSDFIRVMEDLIDVLTDKNLLRVTDLPAEAQDKLQARKNMRKNLKPTN